MKILYLLITLYCFSSLTAQQGNTYSLAQAVEYALKNSPGYLNVQQDERSADYRRKEIAGLGLPQITGSVDFKDYLSLPTSLIPASAFNPSAPSDSYFAAKFGTRFNTTAGLSATQSFFNSDFIFALKSAKEFISLSHISVTRTKADLVSQVSKAYYNAIINKERIKLLDANVVRLKKILDDTRAFNKEGFAELIDVERLEVQYNNLITEKEKTIKLIGLSESLLKFQMGYKLSDPISLADSLNVNMDNFEELNTNKIDITKRPDYQLLKAQQTLYDLDVKRLRWGYLPTLVGYGSYQYNTQRNAFNFAVDNSSAVKQWYKIALVGLTLNLNIFDGLQRNNKIQQARITSLKNQNNFKNIELAAELEATVASISYSNAYSSLLVQKKNMELAQHVLDVAHKKYAGGVGTNIEVVTAETSLREAQTNYFNALFDMLTYKIDYLKAIGTLVK